MSSLQDCPCAGRRGTAVHSTRLWLHTLLPRASLENGFALEPGEGFIPAAVPAALHQVEVDEDADVTAMAMNEEDLEELGVLVDDDEASAASDF
jgi:hypothetical protein